MFPSLLFNLESSKVLYFISVACNKTSLVSHLIKDSSEFRLNQEWVAGREMG